MQVGRGRTRRIRSFATTRHVDVKLDPPPSSSCCDEPRQDLHFVSRASLLVRVFIRARHLILPPTHAREKAVAVCQLTYADRRGMSPNWAGLFQPHQAMRCEHAVMGIDRAEIRSGVKNWCGCWKTRTDTQARTFMNDTRAFMKNSNASLSKY